jgi:hypothetical protein
MEREEETGDKILDPRCLSPLDRSREKKKLAVKIKSKGPKKQTPQVFK